MDISVPSHIAEQISNRCLRCYNEQQWYGENFLFDYIGDSNVSGKSILEIGCAEAGLLKFYFDKGAKCSGMELSDIRFNNAVLLNGDNSLHLFQANICEPQSYDNELVEKCDTIIIRDVIEHIEKANNAIFSFEIIPPKRGTSVQEIIDIVKAKTGGTIRS